MARTEPSLVSPSGGDTCKGVIITRSNTFHHQGKAGLPKGQLRVTSLQELSEVSHIYTAWRKKKKLKSVLTKDTTVSDLSFNRFYPTNQQLGLTGVPPKG